MKKMNGKVIEWELEHNGFHDFDAQAVRAAVERWEAKRFGAPIKMRFNFKFGKGKNYDKRNGNKGTKGTSI